MKTIQITALFFFMIGIQSVSAQKWMDADVNKDRTLDVRDIKGIINTMAGDLTYIASADVNKDGKIDIVDVVAGVKIMCTEDASVTLGICPDRYHPHVVDLGSAGKWSCCNMGGDAPWEMGGRCAWGDTEIHLGRYYFDWEASYGVKHGVCLTTNNSAPCSTSLSNGQRWKGQALEKSRHPTEMSST